MGADETEKRQYGQYRVTIGILGAGFTGKTIGAALARDAHSVWGTTRGAEKFAELETAGISPVQFNGVELNGELQKALGRTTHLVVSIAPPREEDAHSRLGKADPFLKSMNGQKLRELAPQLEWVCYLSTVGVYGNHDGSWIDEDVEPAPTSARSRQRLLAENQWMAFGAEESIRVCILRLSGIYGPGRNALVSASSGKSRRLVKPGQVFNRIHVADIATAVTHAVEGNIGGVFNITDDEPAPPQDVVAFAHELLGTPPPAEIDFETADISPMARSFYGENKRVSNARSKQGLKLDYAHPNYRAALTKMWTEDTWRG